MNIKGLIPGFFKANDVRSVENIGKTIKSDETHDRDANGQQSYDGNQGEHHEAMSEEQIEKAMQHLRNLPAFKEHRWTVALEISEQGRFVVVKDNLGTMIRRIPEVDLWTLSSDTSPRGQLYKRSA